MVRWKTAEERAAGRYNTKRKTARIGALFKRGGGKIRRNIHYSKKPLSIGMGRYGGTIGFRRPRKPRSRKKRYSRKYTY